MITKRQHYTIVELLVVVGIMALIMSIALPSFSKMAKGQATKSSSRNIVAVVKAARSYAITERKNIAIVFVNKTNCATYNIPINYGYTSYLVFEVKKDATDQWIFQNNIDGEVWTDIQPGTLIYYDSSNIIENGITVKASLKNLNLGATTTQFDLKGIVFKSSGQMATTNQIKIRIQEGVYPGGNTDPVVTNTANNITVEINPYTGRLTYL